MEEDKLIKKAKRGEKEAFGLLYDKYVSYIYRYFFLRLGGQKDLAEDLTQEVFMNVWKNIGNYDLRGVPFISYLYRVARNALTDHWRTQKKFVDLESLIESSLVADKDEIESTLDNKKEVEVIKKALFYLDPTYQEVLIMKFIEELSNKEIALALGKSEGAVRVIQHRAIKQLKNYLEKV
jgi:RNA polymerase sigma-70 factor (ECF subfamily)